MTSEEVIQLLREVHSVITESHIVYTSGKHGTAYVNKDAIYPVTKKVSALCRAIAESFAHDGVEVVVAPAIGAIILSQWTADHLTDILGYQVLAVYAEKEVISLPDPDGLSRPCYAETGRFVIRRGYDKLVLGKKTLVVEDILNTGGSAKKVVETTRAIGGKVIGVGSLCNRGGVTSEDIGGALTLKSLVNIKLDSWDEKDCPLCKSGVPINTTVGHGKAFLARQQKT